MVTIIAPNPHDFHSCPPAGEGTGSAGTARGRGWDGSEGVGKAAARSERMGAAGRDGKERIHMEHKLHGQMRTGPGVVMVVKQRRLDSVLISGELFCEEAVVGT